MVEVKRTIEDTPENRNKDFSELLPTKIELANRVLDGMRGAKGDAYKYVELALTHTIGKDGLDKEIEIVWHGTEEVDIRDWNFKIDDYVAKEDYFNMTFANLVNACGMLTKDEQKRLLGDSENDIKGINEIAMNYIAKQLYLKGRAIFENENDGGDGENVELAE